jgi:hypothetical protein
VEIRLKAARRGSCSEIEKADTHAQRSVHSSPRLATGEKPAPLLVHIPAGSIRVVINKRLKIQQEVRSLNA